MLSVVMLSVVMPNVVASFHPTASFPGLHRLRRAAAFRRGPEQRTPERLRRRIKSDRRIERKSGRRGRSWRHLSSAQMEKKRNGWLHLKSIRFFICMSDNVSVCSSVSPPFCM
jgi:hypothetical protein